MPYQKQASGAMDTRKMQMNADRARQEQQMQMAAGPRGLGTPSQEKMASAQKPQRIKAPSNSPSTPWSTSGRKNRLGG